MTDSVSTADTIAKVIRERRTVHLFQPECPPRELILRAIELARWAPNHHHTEPWRFTLLGSETISRVVEWNAELVTAKKGAAAGQAKRERWRAVPGWLAVTCKASDDPLLAEEDYAACCCAIQNLSLYLWAEGVGVKWSTGAVTRHPDFLEMIECDPATERTVGLLWYGYPQHIPEQSRKDISEILREVS